MTDTERCGGCFNLSACCICEQATVDTLLKEALADTPEDVEHEFRNIDAVVDGCNPNRGPNYADHQRDLQDEMDDEADLIGVPAVCVMVGRQVVLCEAHGEWSEWWLCGVHACWNEAFG